MYNCFFHNKPSRWFRQQVEASAVSWSCCISHGPAPRCLPLMTASVPERTTWRDTQLVLSSKGRGLLEPATAASSSDGIAPLFKGTGVASDRVLEDVRRRGDEYYHVIRPSTSSAPRTTSCTTTSMKTSGSSTSEMGWHARHSMRSYRSCRRVIATRCGCANAKSARCYSIMVGSSAFSWRARNSRPHLFAWLGAANLQNRKTCKPQAVARCATWIMNSARLHCDDVWACFPPCSPLYFALGLPAVGNVLYQDCWPLLPGLHGEHVPGPRGIVDAVPLWLLRVPRNEPVATRTELTAALGVTVESLDPPSVVQRMGTPMVAATGFGIALIVTGVIVVLIILILITFAVLKKKSCCRQFARTSNATPTKGPEGLKYNSDVSPAAAE